MVTITYIISSKSYSCFNLPYCVVGSNMQKTKQTTAAATTKKTKEKKKKRKKRGKKKKKKGRGRGWGGGGGWGEKKGNGERIPNTYKTIQFMQTDN